MSMMHKFISELPLVPIISSSADTLATSEDIKRLEEISHAACVEIDGLMAGISVLGEIISIAAIESAEVHKDRIIQLSRLVDIAASTVDGLRFIESEANSILANRERVGGCES